MGNNRKQQALKKKAKQQALTSLYEDHFFKNEDGNLLVKWSVNFDPQTMSLRFEDKSLWKRGQLCFAVDLNNNQQHYFVFRKFTNVNEAIRRTLYFPPWHGTTTNDLDKTLKSTCNLVAEVVDLTTNQTFILPSSRLFKLDDDEGKKHGQNPYITWSLLLCDGYVKEEGEDFIIKTCAPNTVFQDLVRFVPKGKDIFYLNPWTINKTDPHYEVFKDMFFSLITKWSVQTGGKGKQFMDEVMLPYLRQDVEGRLTPYLFWYNNLRS